MNRRDFFSKIKQNTYLLPFILTSFSNAKYIHPFTASIFELPSTSLFDKNVHLKEKYIINIENVRAKLKQVQDYVGYGNFNIISFDTTRYILKRYKGMKDFTKDELSFIEYIFYYKPEVHGFYGDRISNNLTLKINKKDVKKIPYTGHYLFKEKSVSTYQHMVKDLGENIILTSGVRSIVKQMKLFLDKINSSNYDLSKASKSIAPPAFTYHTIGDFDVGKKGFGTANFTARFALTQEFKAMQKLKYIDMRYTINNKDGVRYEPWHVKII